jgi:hypothetical protein
VARVGCQLGHVPRTSGKTGTGGCCGETEQDYVKRLFNTLDPKLRAAGHTPIRILADPEDGYPAMDVFIAFHCDGSVNTSARGCSFGFRTDLSNATASKKFGDRWRAEHLAAGYPGGNRPTNNTKALANYYALDDALAAGADQAIVVEFGFLTNKADNDWLIENVGKVADALVTTVVAFHGGTPPEEDLSIVDPATKEFLVQQFKEIDDHFRTVLRGDESSPRTHPNNLENILERINSLQDDVDRIKQKLQITG